MAGGDIISEEAFKTALKKCGGFHTRTAKALGISQQAVSKRIKASETLRAFQVEVQEGFLDMAEFKLLEAVERGEKWAVTFYLKCKGKDRGYIERSENIYAGSEDLPPLNIVCPK